MKTFFKNAIVSKEASDFISAIAKSKNTSKSAVADEFIKLETESEIINYARLLKEIRNNIEIAVSSASNDKSALKIISSCIYFFENQESDVNHEKLIKFNKDIVNLIAKMEA